MEQRCAECCAVEFYDGGDGFSYCVNCHNQAKDLINACIDDDDLFNTGMYSQRRARPTPKSQSQPEYSELPKSGAGGVDDDVKLGDGVGPLGPTDFGGSAVNFSYEGYYSAIRLRYLLGFQIMLQLQSKALVEHFNVSAGIVDLHNPIWLRLLARTSVMDDDWADKVVQQSELHNLGDVTESQRSATHSEEPQNMFGQRAVMIWYRSLHSCLPISYTLALSFLFCHVAEEPILPTDILKGVLEGKIPYFSAFVDIEKQLGAPPPSCPISSSVMFRPTQVISLQKLEATAACISEKIGLELQPLDFNSLATRYIKDLSLSVPKILPLASRIYEWSMPRGIHLSSDELKLPSRVCLMSILVVAVRIYYNINGFGKWESTMSDSSDSLSPDKLSGKEKHTLESDVLELFNTFDGKFNKLRELHDTFEHHKDLPTYLQFCKDNVCAGVEPSLENEENNLIETLWKFYLESEPSQNGIIRPSDGDVCTLTDSKSLQGEGENSQFSQDKSNFCEREDIVQETPIEVSSHQKSTISLVKRDMEENKFVYIPPRSNVKKHEHIYYCRKKGKGAYVYAVHGDYYILLRSCAKACQVDLRTMHIGVLTFERGLQKREREKNGSEVFKKRNRSSQ